MKMTWRRGTAYSQDLRDRVLAYSDAGELVGKIAAALCVSISYVSKVLSRRDRTGEVSARPQRCHVRPKLAGLYEAIQTEVKARPDSTLLAADATADRGVRVGPRLRRRRFLFWVAGLCGVKPSGGQGDGPAWPPHRHRSWGEHDDGGAARSAGDQRALATIRGARRAGGRRR